MMNQREAFEDWARDSGYALLKTGLNQYFYSDTGAAWDAWQAARESEPMEHAELSEPMTEEFKAAWKNGLPLDSMEAKWAFVGWQEAAKLYTPPKQARAQGREAAGWTKWFNGKQYLVERDAFLPEDAISQGWKPLVYASATPQPNKWIPCSASLPAEKLWVSGLTNAGQVIPAMLINNGDSAFFRTANDEISEGTIVKWQPLPAPPEQETE